MDKPTFSISTETGKQNTSFSSSVWQIQESKERIWLKIHDLESAVSRLRNVTSGTSMEGRHSELRFRIKSRSGQQQQHGGDLYDEQVSHTPTSINSDQFDEVRIILADIDRHLTLLRDIEREHGTICERYTKEIIQRDEMLESKNAQLKKLQNELELIQVQKINSSDETQKPENDEIKIESVMTAPGAMNPNAENVYRFHEEVKPLDFRQLYFDLLKKNYTARVEELESQPVVEDEADPPESMSDPTSNFLKSFNPKQTKKDENDAHVKIDLHEPIKTELKIERKKNFENISTDPNYVSIDDAAIKDNDRERAKLEKKQELMAQLNRDIEIIELSDTENEFKVFETALERARRVYVDSTVSNNERIGAGVELLNGANGIYGNFLKLKEASDVWHNAEQELRNRLVDQQAEYEELKAIHEDLEFKYSEVKYDLDITKHNYDLELESFGSAVNERESLIEKLQAKVEAFKKRYQTLEGRLQEAVTKEVEYLSKIEEAQGRVLYEQAARENLIDARLEESEIQMKEIENELENVKKEFDEQINEKDIIMLDLRERIKELEISLKKSAGSEGEERFSYYKNRIETLGAQVESERAQRKSFELQLESQSKNFQRLLENSQIEMAKEKEQILQEKTIAEQKYRKLTTKFKSKEREILSLEENLRALNKSFEDNSQEPLEVIEEDGILGVPEQRTDKRYAAQLALKEARLLEVQTKLDNTEEQLLELGETLTKERARRKELEVFYLSNGNSKKSLLGGLIPGRAQQAQTNNNYNMLAKHQNGNIRKRLGSMTTFSMNMDNARSTGEDKSIYENEEDKKEKQRPRNGMTIYRLIMVGATIYTLLFCLYILIYRQ